MTLMNWMRPLLNGLGRLLPKPLRPRSSAAAAEFDLLDHISVKEFFDKDDHLSSRRFREWISLHESRLKRAENYVESKERETIRQMIERNREILKGFGVNVADSKDQEDIIREERVFMFHQIKLSRARRYIQAEQISKERERRFGKHKKLDTSDED